MLGASGAAVVKACPEWLEDLLKPSKTYFLPSVESPFIPDLFQHMMDMSGFYAVPPPTGFKLINVCNPGVIDEHFRDAYILGESGPEMAGLDGISAYSDASLDEVGPWQGISREVSPLSEQRLDAALKHFLK